MIAVNYLNLDNSLYIISFEDIFAQMIPTVQGSFSTFIIYSSNYFFRIHQECFFC